MSAPSIGSFLCIHAYWKSNISGISHTEAGVPIPQTCIDSLCLPTSHCHLIELKNGRIVCCIFNGRKKSKLNSFTSSAFSAVLCLSTCCAAKFPKSICSSYCENTELVHVMPELFYPCQMVLYILIVLGLGFTNHSGACHFFSYRQQRS